MNDDSASSAISSALNSNWKSAIEINNRILKETPDDIDSLNRLGRAYIETGDFKKAATCFKKVLKLDKYHPIAQKNLERLESIDKRKTNHDSNTQKLSVNFVEEPGKTKVVALVNVANKQTLSNLRPGTPVTLVSKRHTIIACLENQDVYLGSLPDDVAHRLDILIKGGNTYESFVKSVSGSQATIFLREICRGRKFSNIVSFSTAIGDRLNPVTEQLEDKDVLAKQEKNTDDEDDGILAKSARLHADEEPDN